jgi:hypothetical protein
MDANILIEVERAIDNLFKSGKLFGMPGRRDSLPMMGGPRPFPEYGMSSHHKTDTSDGPKILVWVEPCLDISH